MVFERMKSVFRRKKSQDVRLPNIGGPLPPPIALPSRVPEMSIESATADNMKAKVDLLLTQVEALNIRYETLNERLRNIERMIQEIYMIAKRP